MPEHLILIVDSDQASLNYLTQFLQKQGFKVLQSGLGKEGLIYAWRDHPQLILFDPHLSDISSIEFVKKLRQDPRTAATPILALSSDQNPQKKDALLEAGVTDFHIKNSDLILELPVIIPQTLNKPLPQQKDAGHLIVFMSAKGGVGTSSLCANFAASMAQHKPDAFIVVVDLVLPLGSLGSIVGNTSEIDLVSIADLRSDEITSSYFSKKLPKFPLWGFQLLPAPSHPERSNQLNIARIPEILAVLRATYDYVIIDLGRSLSRISLPILQQADLLSLVVSNEQSAVELTKSVCDYLRNLSIDPNSIFVLINRAVGLEGLTKKQIEAELEMPVRKNLPHMEGDFTLANNLHQPITKKYPQASITLALKEASLEMITQITENRTRL
ncbi:MAG: response regulator [Anaerolineales bacterium]